MVKINYYDLYREMKNPSSMRLNMVLYALEHSISRTAREFGSTRVTVMKWIKRYQEKGRSGLCDVSRRPSHSPSRISSEGSLWERIWKRKSSRSVIGILIRDLIALRMNTISLV